LSIFRIPEAAQGHALAGQKGRLPRLPLEQDGRIMPGIGVIQTPARGIKHGVKLGDKGIHIGDLGDEVVVQFVEYGAGSCGYIGDQPEDGASHEHDEGRGHAAAHGIGHREP